MYVGILRWYVFQENFYLRANYYLSLIYANVWWDFDGGIGNSIKTIQKKVIISVVLLRLFFAFQSWFSTLPGQQTHFYIQSLHNLLLNLCTNIQNHLHIIYIYITSVNSKFITSIYFSRLPSCTVVSIKCNGYTGHILYSSYYNYYLWVKSILDSIIPPVNVAGLSVLGDYRGHGYLEAAAAISMFILPIWIYYVLQLYEWAVTVVMATDS